MIIVTLVLCAAAGVGVRVALDRVVLSSRMRRRLGAALVGLVALVPVAGVAAVAKSSRGLTGEISHLWSELTNAKGGATDQPGRLVQLSNSRPHYWSIALRVGEHHPVAGVGAAGFGTAEGLYGAAASYARAFYAHGYVVQTFADFGAIGLAISLAALIAWCLAAARTLEFGRWRPREPGRGPPVDGAGETSQPVPAAEPAGETLQTPTAAEIVAERPGMIALLAIVVTFGLHSLIDWTWFVPGDAVTALVCAGWLAGRGPLSRPIGRVAKRRSPSRSPALVASLLAIAVVTVAAVWGIAQPLRSYDSDSAAITEALQGNGGAALADAHTAASEDPVSVDPLFLLSRLYSELRDGAASRQELLDAVSRQPANPESWQQLGCYDFAHGRTGSGVSEIRRGEVLESGQPWISQSEFCAASF